MDLLALLFYMRRGLENYNLEEELWKRRYSIQRSIKQVVVEAKEEDNIPQEKAVNKVEMVEQAHLGDVEEENNPIIVRIQLQEVEDMEGVEE